MTNWYAVAYICGGLAFMLGSLIHSFYEWYYDLYGFRARSKYYDKIARAKHEQFAKTVWKKAPEGWKAPRSR